MDRSFLKKRGNAWFVRVQVPQKLWAAVGRREFVKALGTLELAEANRRKHVHVAEYHRRIELAERGLSDPLAEVMAKAMEFQEAHSRLKDQVTIIERGHADPDEVDHRDEHLDLIREQARELIETHGSEVASRFFGAATGRAVFLRDVYPRWLDETAPKPKQRDTHEVALKSFLAWAGEAATVEEVNRPKAGDYLSRLIDSGKLSRSTINRYRSTLSTLWTWLGEKGLADPERNPWRGHRSLSRAKDTRARKRKGLTDVQVVKLLSRVYDTPTYRSAIADLTRLALVTGCRLEELCGLQGQDVEKRADGWWVAIREGKTENATRRVPVHQAVEHVLVRRSRGADAFLFDELSPGPYGRRSHHLSKAYGRFRAKAGVAGRGEDFHALRHTVTGALEGAGVPLTTIQLLIGHSRKSSMGTTAVYTAGDRVDLRAAVERLHYGPEAMGLLATDIVSSTATTTERD